MRTAKQEDLIRRLNPLIKGWANYHSNQVSKATYQKADHLTWQKLWKWAKRRHPNKGLRWIKGRYFHRVGHRDWIFGVRTKTREGEGLYRLAFHADTPIRRHVQIKAEANPFDPKWEIYFEEREARLMNRVLTGKLKSLWKQQEGTCPICQQQCTLDQEWVIHHITHRAKGGSDTLDNLQLLHGNCHRQVHAKHKLDELPVLQ